MRGKPPGPRALGAAAAALIAAAPAVCAAPAGSEASEAGSRWRTTVEASIGTDGAASAFFVAKEGGRLSAGLRAGLGFELTDFRWNDPSAALALRWRLLGSPRWAWWLGAEAGAAAVDTGYDRFILPFATAATGGSFRFGARLTVFLEAGYRYGRRDLTSAAALDFLDARYEETYFIDPALVRLGIALRF